MLTIHHLRKSQSERSVWLCEELEVPYELMCYDRDPVTLLAPPDYKKLHPMGAAPVITEGELTLAESGAVTEYIIEKHGQGRLTLGATHPDFAQYLYWFHFANGTLQPVMGRNMFLRRLNLPPDNATLVATLARLHLALDMVDRRLREVDFLAGPFSAADIMAFFSLTTMRYFFPVDLAPYGHIRAYLGRIGEREAYRRAMRKGDPDMALLLA